MKHGFFTGIFTRISAVSVATVFALTSVASAAVPFFLSQTANAASESITQIVFTNESFETDENEEIILSVQLRNNGNTEEQLDKGGTRIYLSSSSSTGKFAEGYSSNSWKDSPDYSFREGSANKSFRYKDSTRGTHTITASVKDGGLSNTVTTEQKIIVGEPFSPVITPTNFNTHSGDDYKGVNVGFTLNNDFRNVSAVSVDLYSGENILTTNTENDNLLTLINSGETSLSTPFITTPGTYQETHWNLGAFTGNKNTKPSKAVITITDENGTYSAENNSFTEPNGWLFATLFPVDSSKPVIIVNTQHNAINPSAVSVTASDNEQLKQVTSHIYNQSNTSLVKNCSVNIEALNVKEYTHSCSIDTMNLADGVYTIRANARDTADLLSATVSSVQFIIDSTAPKVSVKPESLGSLSHNVFKNVSFKLYDNHKVSHYDINGTKTSVTPNQWSDANYITVGSRGAVYGKNTITLYDLAGNSSELIFYLDNVAPTITIKPESLGSTDQNVFRTVSFKLYDAYKVKGYYLNSNSFKSLTPNTYSDANSISVGKNGGIEGVNTLTLEDIAGNQKVFTFTLDTTAPTKVNGLTAYTTAKDEITDVTREYSVTFKWNAISDAAKYEYCYWNEVSTSVYRETNCYTTYPGGPTTSGVFNQGEGAHFVKVRAIDVAGNIGEWSDTLRVYYLVNEAAVNGENFNTHDGDDYRGVNVGFNIAHFTQVTGVTVELFSGNTPLGTNTHNQKLLDLINNGGVTQLSTPFIISGPYVEEYWELEAYKWTADSPKPTRAVVTVAGLNNAGEAAEVETVLTSLAEADGITFASLLPVLVSIPRVDTDTGEGGNNDEDGGQNVLGDDTDQQSPRSVAFTSTDEGTPRPSSGTDNQLLPDEEDEDGKVEAAKTLAAEQADENEKEIVEAASSSATWYWILAVIALLVATYYAYRNYSSYSKRD